MGCRPRVWVAQSGPFVAVAAAAVALLTELGVGKEEIAAYCGYEIGFVVVPGVLVAVALDGWSDGLRLLSLGWAVGYTLSTIAFAATAAGGRTGWYLAYPFVVSIGASAWILARRRQRPVARRSPASSPGGGRWWLALVAIAALGLLAAEYMAPQPLPRDLTHGAQYNGDSMYLMSLAGEAEHRFPLTDPTVAGTPLDYHVLSLVDMGASATVTRIELSVIVLRLAYVPLLLVLILEIAWLARYRGRCLAIGALAAAVVLLVGEIDLTPSLDYPFLDIFYTLLWFAPAAASMIIFVPLAVLLGETLRVPGGRRSKGRWVLIVVLLVGAAGTKGANVLPVFLAAALALAAWRVWVRRGLDGQGRAALGVAALMAASLIAADLLEYGGGRRGLTLSPLASFHEMAPLESLRPVLGGGLLGGVYWWALVPILGLVGLLSSQAAGLGLVLRRPRPARHPIDGWLLALAACSLLPLFLFNQPGLSHLHSMAYGRIAVGVLVADGLASPATRQALQRLRPLAGAGVAALVAVGGVGLLPLVASLSADETYAIDYGVAAATLAGAAVLGRIAGGRWAAVVAAVVALTGVAALNTPLDALPRVVDDVLHGRPVAAQGDVELTPALYRGLRWLRNHSTPADVLAVNNQTLGRSGPPVDFYYSAISERRVFLEGWANTERALDLGYRRVVSGRLRPFPGREQLNRAVFADASKRALHVLITEFGVRYLVVDDQAGAAGSGLARIARLVYDQPGVQIYAATAR